MDTMMITITIITTTIITTIDRVKYRESGRWNPSIALPAEKK